MGAALNFLLFQIGWFGSVLGAAYGVPWLGVLAVLLVLTLNLIWAQDWMKELIIALGAAVMGFAVDSSLVASGVFSPVPYLTPHPFSPLWMVMLWVNQATTLNSSLRWLRGRYLAGALFGAIGGPLAYLGGAKLGAARLPSDKSLLVLGVVWAGAFPMLLAMAEFLHSLKRKKA